MAGPLLYCWSLTTKGANAQSDSSRLSRVYRDSMARTKTGGVNMAALRMESRSDNRQEVTRLGRREIHTTVHTWRTFVKVSVGKDGRAYAAIWRNGKEAASMSIEEEGDQGADHVCIACGPEGVASVTRRPWTREG